MSNIQIGSVVKCGYGSPESEELLVEDVQVLARREVAGVVTYLCREVNDSTNIVHARSSHHNGSDIIANINMRVSDVSGLDSIARRWGFVL